jgi:hypothetical protein
MNESPEEQWRKIPGHPEIYEVSNFGRARRLAYKFKTSYRGAPMERSRSAKVFPSFADRVGYHRVKLGSRLVSLHRIVAAAWIPNPHNKPQINHKNGIKSDNRIDNLECVTREENRDHALINGLYPRGSKHPRHILTEEDAWTIRKALQHNVPQEKLAKLFGVSQKTISSIATMRSWHYG